MKDTEGYVTADGRQIGGTLMEMKNITLRFGGVVAIQDISFDIREGEVRAIIGPIVDAERHFRVLYAVGRRGLVSRCQTPPDETV